MQHGVGRVVLATPSVSMNNAAKPADPHVFEVDELKGIGTAA